jgi:hypothetical protein
MLEPAAKLQIIPAVALFISLDHTANLEIFIFTVLEIRPFQSLFANC